MLDALALTEATTKKHVVDDNNNNNDDDVSVCSMGVDAVLSSSTSCSCQDTDWQKTSLILWPHDVFKTLFDAGPAVLFRSFDLIAGTSVPSLIRDTDGQV